MEDRSGIFSSRENVLTNPRKIMPRLIAVQNSGRLNDDVRRNRKYEP